ncbi:PLAC8-domain-containing protein [Xylariomycetidae sp. FL2044]|nr:PLAC8-domain-containing protein [Xylariomycetidae sp. FL2044]
MATPEKTANGFPPSHYPQDHQPYPPQGPQQQYPPHHQSQPHAQQPMSAAHQYQSNHMAHPAHPTAYGQKGGKWQTSLCSCSPFSSCLLGWCLPCILVGQTAERIRDPSLQNADMMNSDCLIHGAITCFTGCGWIYAMMKRGEIRERYDIEGSGCGDCCTSYWCPCCDVIQQDNEVKMRQQAGQPTTQGYQSQPSMQMPQQAYHPQ